MGSGRSARWVLLALATHVPAAGATTVTWSGPASPCGSTLQDCIAGADPGDIVRVATNGSINENLTINKSLTVRAVAGFTPVLAQSRFVSISNPSPQSNTVVFEGFTMTRGFVDALQLSENPFDVTLRALVFQDVSSPGIRIRTGATPLYGPFTFAITDNEMTLPPSVLGTPKEAISVHNEAAELIQGVIRDNRIDHFAVGQQGAIQFFHIDKPLEIDVIRNDIRGSGYAYGVQTFQTGSALSRYRIYDNLVVGAAYGIIVRPGPAANCHAQVVNNTVVDGGAGIMVSTAMPAPVSGAVANNIIANMSSVGLQIDADIAGTVAEHHNIIYNAPLFDFVPGPGTLLMAPHFVSSSNYRLTMASPARNAGEDDSVPDDLMIDLDGAPRMVGHVDMGAYESGLTVSTPIAIERYRLNPNYPNPFNPTTTITYEIAQAERVRLGIFDAQGRVVRWLVAGAVRGAGSHRSVWDGRNTAGLSMPSGIYFYRLEAGPFVDSQRMVLAR